MARLPQVTGNLDDEEIKCRSEMTARRASVGSTVSGPYVPLLHHPRLASPIERLGFYLKYEGLLPRDIYETVILAVAERGKMVFVWHEHVGPARSAGLPEEIIAAIARGERSVSAPYSKVLEAADEVLALKILDRGLQQELIELFGTKGLIELVATCGFYQLIGAVNASFDVPLHEGKRSPFISGENPGGQPL
jgi:4-carboxymuconolactone decarboxylase